MMKINLSDINNTDGKSCGFSFTASACELDFPAECGIDGAVVVSGRAANTGLGYHIKGSVKCHRHFVCDRCLERSEESQTHAFDEVYRENTSAEQDTDLSGEIFIDISDLVRDTVLAGQPIKSICRPHCKGLCPKCGANLNKGDCGCDRTTIDPRLSILKNLLEKK